MAELDTTCKVQESSSNAAYEIRAQWDSEAGVWVAESEDVPGLDAEADSLNVLVQKLTILSPELNGVLSDRTANFPHCTNTKKVAA